MSATEHINKFVAGQKGQSARTIHLTLLHSAELAREQFRQAGQWQQFSEACMECGRLGRLLRLDEMQNRNEKQ